MSKSNEIKLSKHKFDSYFNLPNPNLRSYFDTVERGRDEIYHTPWIKSEDNKAILAELRNIIDEWMPHLETLSKEWPSLYEFEKDLSAKVGPMSLEKPLKERLDDIEAYYSGILLPAEPLDERAVKATIAKYSRIKGISLRSQQKTVDKMNLAKNAGSPYYQKKRSVLAKTVPCTISGDYQILDADKEWRYCAILGWRGQEGGPEMDDVKQRVVWMFPFAVNIEELRAYQPMIEAIQHFNINPAWVSMDAVDQGITKLFDTKAADDYIVCTDFSKFDQHFGPVLQDAAKAIESALLTRSSESQKWLETIFPIKYNIPLAYDWDKVRIGHHGMGSGSGGTNFDESLSHNGLQFEVAISQNQRLNPNSQCLGDDGVLSYPGIDVEDVMRSYTKHGLEMNAEKQYVSKQDCVYLRRWHHHNYRVDGVCVGVYSTARALGRLCMQERYYDPDKWGPKMVALRELSIIENCKYHPLKEEFAEFCMKRDKFRLGLDIPGFLDNIEKEAKNAMDLMPDFLGYTKTQMSVKQGIADWWIVKYLKSKA